MSNRGAALQSQIAGHDHHGGDPGLGLVSPVTGLANDYLNMFNEILLVLEFLPTMPEMTDEALAWRPRSYREYFQQSPLPGAREAARRYDKVDPALRARFESLLKRLNDIALDAQARVAEEMNSPNFPEFDRRTLRGDRRGDARGPRLCGAADQRGPGEPGAREQARQQDDAIEETAEAEPWMKC